MPPFFPCPRRNGGWLAAFSLIFLIGCDSAADETCPPEPSSQEAAYFPRTVGTEWRYAYQHGIGSESAPTSRATTGTLTWTLEAVECEPDVTRLRLVERFEGVEREVWYHGGVLSEEPRAWTKPIAARLEGSRLVIPGYTDRVPELQWIYPRTAPDTVRHSVLHTAGNGTADETGVLLARDVGIVRWADGQHGRFNNSRTIELIDE